MVRQESPKNVWKKKSREKCGNKSLFIVLRQSSRETGTEKGRETGERGGRNMHNLHNKNVATTVTLYRKDNVF